ncbi:hypothetical protein Tco_1063567 [Tanacetum coccineum]
MAFDLRPTEDVLPWPGNPNMAFDLRSTEDVLPWPGNANMAFDLRPTEDVLPWPGNANMAFDLRPTEDVLPWPGICRYDDATLARQDKRKGLQSRLDFGDTPKRARRIRSDSLSSGDSETIEIVLRTGAAPESEDTSAVSKNLMAIPTPPKGLGTEIAPAIMTTTGV